MVEMIIAVAAGVLIGGLLLDLLKRFFVWFRGAESNKIGIPTKVLEEPLNAELPNYEITEKAVKRKRFNAEDNAIKRAMERDLQRLKDGR